MHSELHEDPAGLIQPTIGGDGPSRGEWTNAGTYRVDVRSGAMHCQRSLLQQLRYGTDGRKMFFRVEMAEPLTAGSSFEVRMKLRNHAAEQFEIRAAQTPLGSCQIAADLPEDSVTVAMGETFEAGVSLSALRTRLGDPLFLHLEVFRDELPVAFLPASGELELRSGSLAAYAY